MESLRTFNNVGRTINQARANHPKQYSQSELSKLLGYKNGQFISNVERGLCSIPLKKLSKVCEVLDIKKGALSGAIQQDNQETIDRYLEL